MILPDVNVLVLAAHADAEKHEPYAAWLAAALAGPEEVALAEPVLTGCVRLLTAVRVFSDPMPTTVALAFVAALRSARATRTVAGSDPAWARLSTLVRDDPGIRGNRVPDAWLAALALTHGARVATADRGFGRYPGLAFFDPCALALVAPVCPSCVSRAR